MDGHAGPPLQYRYSSSCIKSIRVARRVALCRDAQLVRPLYQSETHTNKRSLLTQQSPLLIRPNLSPQHPCSNGRCSARPKSKARELRPQGVLILVLMEDALRVCQEDSETTTPSSLNPCSNGRCSARDAINATTTRFNIVLILVLMEDALRAYRYIRGIYFDKWVLILVLMEDALREEAYFVDETDNGMS